MPTLKRDRIKAAVWQTRINDVVDASIRYVEANETFDPRSALPKAEKKLIAAARALARVAEQEQE